MSRPRLLTRRELTVAASGIVVAAHVPDAWAARLLRKTAAPGPGRFLDGVASGDPTSTSMVFWSRLTTDRQRSGARLVVAADEGLTRTVATVVVPTSRGVDGVLKVRVTGLQPGTVYYYAWQSAEAVSPVGRTKTFNPADSAAPLRVAASSCQNWAQGFFTPHADAAAGDPLDLYVFLGDYTYEYGSRREVRTEPSAAVDLQTYRDKLQLYRSDAALRELHRLHPTAHVWDDHEVANNYSDNAPAPSPLQRTAAYKASFEWLPHLPSAGQRYGLYRSYRLGAGAEVLMLDARQYRSGYNDGAPRSVLGRGQLEWFKAALQGSTARFKLVANPVMFAPLRIPGRGLNSDSWDGALDERREVLDVIAGVGDVVFLSGDTHTFFTAKVLRDGGTSGAAVATEYLPGSVSSRGLPGFDGATAQSVFEGSPWITFVDGDDHGYALVEANPGALRVTYRASDLSQAAGGSRTLAVYDQAAGANDYVTTYQDPNKPVPPEPQEAGATDGGRDPAPTAATVLPAAPSARSLSSARAPSRELARRRRKLERAERDAHDAAERAARRATRTGRR